MTISIEEALQRARRCAEERGWVWQEPVRVTRSCAFILVGRLRYDVWTNAEMRGCNARIVVDADDGSITEAHWLPRFLTVAEIRRNRDIEPSAEK